MDNLTEEEVLNNAAEELKKKAKDSIISVDDLEALGLSVDDRVTVSTILRRDGYLIEDTSMSEYEKSLLDDIGAETTIDDSVKIYLKQIGQVALVISE